MNWMDIMVMAFGLLTVVGVASLMIANILLIQENKRLKEEIGRIDKRGTK